MFHLHKQLTIVTFLLVLALSAVPLREVAADTSRAGSHPVMTTERSVTLSPAKATAAVKLLSAVDAWAVGEARGEGGEHLARAARSTTDEADPLLP
jgi:hypothetical protein